MTNRTRAAVVRKLRPIHCSGRFRAILGCLLGETWTDPRIVSLVVTSDRMLLAQHEGDIGYNDFIGAASCLIDNLTGIAKVADLTPAQTRYLVGLGRALGA